MYAIGHEPPAVEKIKPPKWRPENTRQTQRVVDDLERTRKSARAVLGNNSDVVHALERAMQRFHELDPQIVIPFF